LPRSPKPRTEKQQAPQPKGLPSRDEILKFIASSPGVVGKREISRAFGIKGNDKIKLKSLLKDMQGDGSVAGKKRRMVAKGHLPPVTVIEVVGIDKDGEAFGVPVEWADDKPPKLLIESTTGKSPAVGDRVLAKIEALSGKGPYSHRAKVMRALSDRAGRVLAIFRIMRGEGARLVPVDKKARYDLQVMKGDEGGALNGELVAAEIIKDQGRGMPIARVRERLGNMEDPRNISLIAIHQHGIPNAFPEKVLAESEALKSFREAGRMDLRKVPLITIDPPDARDHDDAVWAEANDDGGFNIIVAIADVATYVRPGSALDKEARLRGNSVYFPDRVVPMLPERISNDLCSLREKENRPALACFMTFDKSGRKKSHKFARVIMRSAAKLSYEEAQAAIDGRESPKADGLLEPVLKPLWAAYFTMKKAQDSRSPLALELPERKIILDDKGSVARVTVPARLDAHRLIEEFMIQANVAAAEELENRKSPLLYRIHEAPSQEKIKALSQFLKTVNRELPLGQVMKPSHFNKLLASVKGEDFEQLVHQIVLRTQSQAVYRSQNAGHFGLSLRRYAHFTSPIRRYADLIVHRALISALGVGDDGLSTDDIAMIDETAELISVAERRAMTAERETTDRLIASYLAPQVGAVFNGRIGGVVGAGLFVNLEESGADGFVPASSLGRDYFVYDEVRHALIGERTGETFQLGDVVQVKLIEAAPVKGGLKFEMVSQGRKGDRPKLRGNARKPTRGKRR
jgi:ribonuclease R